MKAQIAAIFSLAVLSAAAFGAPDGPPTFNVEPSCRAAASASGNQGRLKGCLDSERKAREKLVKEWRQFSPATRSTYLRASTIGGEPTYTELITCLEMTRDVKKTRPANRHA